MVPRRITFLAQNQRIGYRGMKIYTKTGDKGTSQLFSGERRPKDNDVFQALGDTDELNAHLGMAWEYASSSANHILPSKIQQIQSRLFDIGACIATPLNNAPNSKKKRAGQFNEANVQILEQWIDEMDANLPPLTSFILPSGGGFTSTQLHIARSVCRRTERRVAPLASRGEVDTVVLRYLNRLSDFLFVAARSAAASDGREEIKWTNQNILTEQREDSSDDSADESNKPQV